VWGPRRERGAGGLAPPSHESDSTIIRTRGRDNGHAAARDGSTFGLAFTQEELARELSTPLESVSRAIGELRTARIVERDGSNLRFGAFRSAILGQAPVWLLEITRRHPGSPHQPHSLEQRLEARL
jgi:hypothetical protein